MLVGRTLAVVGVGLALAGCCCESRSRCERPCAPSGASDTITVPAQMPVPMPTPTPAPTPQPTPSVVADIPKPDAARRRAEILATLDTKHVKGASFTDASLDQIATYFRTVTGVEFRISAKAREANAAATRVTVPVLEDVTARQLLDLVIVPTGLVWAVRDDGVEIGAPGE